jgi:hypothetical protein
MPDKMPNSEDHRSYQRQAALGTGGSIKATVSTVQADAVLGSESEVTPPLSDAELVQLRVRVIALENIVIALLAQVPEPQLALVREMATHISPRQGFTPHPVTIHAAAEIDSLVRRAHAFRLDERAQETQAMK